nr:hypothetical protein [Tanacetum cinerariifolium]
SIAFDQYDFRRTFNLDGKHLRRSSALVHQFHVEVDSIIGFLNSANKAVATCQQGLHGVYRFLAFFRILIYYRLVPKGHGYNYCEGSILEVTKGVLAIFSASTNRSSVAGSEAGMPQTWFCRGYKAAGLRAAQSSRARPTPLSEVVVEMGIPCCDPLAALM